MVISIFYAAILKLAFVTKKEFEALKTDFANQITSYNNSIDSKIDGAIVSYLASMSKKKIPQTNQYAVITRAGRISQGQWAFNEIYYCNHDKTDSSKVYVESLRDIVPKFTFTDQYVFSAYS